MSSLEHLSPKDRSFGYATALLVNFIDQLGGGFLLPIQYALGREMGASDSQIATWGLVRGFFMLFSTIGLSMLSDRTSRRTAVVVSITGSAIAYFTQSFAATYYGKTFGEGEWWEFTVQGIALFTVGRAIAGAFAGTSPVLRAFVSDLYVGEPTELKQRLVAMQTMQTALGLGLGPIAGSVGRYGGLAFPIYIAVASSVFGCFWVLAFFPAGQEQKKDEDDQGALKQGESSISQAPPTRSPYCDPAIIAFGVSFIFMATNFAGALGLLIPRLLFETDILGLPDDISDSERQASIAQVQGLLGLPNGLASLFVTIFLYTPLTERYGEAIPLGIAGTCAALLFRSYSLVNEMWLLYLINGGVGACFGMIFPSVGPIIAKYAEVVYPQSKATVQAIPMMGMAVGMMVGPNFLAAVVQRPDLVDVWTVCALLTLMGTICLLFGERLVRQATDVHQEGSEVQQKSLEDTISDPVGFAKFAAQQVEEYILKHGGHSSKYRPVQSLVMARLLSSYPELPEYKTETKGQEVREAMWEQMGEFDGMREEWETMFQGFTIKGQYHDKESAAASNVVVSGGGMDNMANFHIAQLSKERPRRRNQRASHRPSSAATELLAVA